MAEQKGRGVDREKQNSQVLQLNGHTVVNNPKLQQSDRLQSHKNPDHRVNGVIYDSYAPILMRFSSGRLKEHSQFDYLVGHERLKLLESGESFDEWADIDDFFTQDGIRELYELCASTAIDGMVQKVKSGQTRHILLNIQDLPCAAFQGGYLAVTKKLEENLKEEKYRDLEGVVVFFPGAKRQIKKAEHKRALNETWLVYPNEDIEFHVIKGQL